MLPIIVVFSFKIILHCINPEFEILFSFFVHGFLVVLNPQRNNLFIYYLKKKTKRKD